MKSAIKRPVRAQETDGDNLCYIGRPKLNRTFLLAEFGFLYELLHLVNNMLRDNSEILSV